MKTNSFSPRCGVLTLSDKAARGEREDTSGASVRAMLTAAGFECCVYAMLADEQAAIEACLIKWTDELDLDVIVTTGGTGVSPRDLTPEATKRVIDRELPGLTEAMRHESLRHTLHAVWSRGVAGIRAQTLIINLPGSKKAAAENLAVILPALAHGIEKIRGAEADCAASALAMKGLPNQKVYP